MKEKSKKVAVHKDFHGAMSYGMQYVYEKYGEKAMVDYLKQIAKNVYRPLIENMKKEGLPALEKHWKHVFTVEEGKFKMKKKGNELVLEVIECPAIAHMKKAGYPIFHKFCEHTRIINEEICHAAGYKSSVDYNQEKGQCVQKFWRSK